MPLLRRREGFLRTLVLGLGLLALVDAPASRGAKAGAVTGARRTAVVEAVEKTQPCVVSISSEKKAESNSRWPFSAEENQRPRVSGMGSGVIVDRRGYILTNHHVVDKVQGIVVQLVRRHELPGPGPPVRPGDGPGDAQGRADRPLPAIAIGTSSDLMVGETVITIGNAFGYENTVSVGIVSALHRDVTLSDEQVYRNLIQTDACINPGNSGGPLINIDGELIGINVAVRAGAQGIGFALPIDEVKQVAAEMISTRRLASTWHGLVADEVRRGGRACGRGRRGPAGEPGGGGGVQGRATSWSGSATCAVTSTPRPRAGLARRRARAADERGGPPGGAEQTLGARRPAPAPGGSGAGRQRAERPGLAVARAQDHAGHHRVRLGRLPQAPRRPLRPGRLAGQPRRPGGHPEGGHPGGHERRDPALGDDPARQHPLRPSPARGRSRPKAPCSTSSAATGSSRGGSASRRPG